MRKYSPILLLGWCALMICTLLVNLFLLEKYSDNNVRDTSKGIYNLAIAIRLWNANHKMVYVPVTETMRPNSYLQHPNRDVITNNGDTLTMVNPAFMTRQIAEFVQSIAEYELHITSLNSISPSNKTKDWEQKALSTFNGPDDEYFEKITVNDTFIYRYMAPEVTKQSCLQCHAAQGYKLNDIKGGISITIPIAKDKYIFSTRNKIILIYTIIFLVGVLIILYFMSSLKKDRDNIQRQNRQLQEANLSKDKFFNIVAHDLRTPAANLVSLSDALRKQDGEINSEDQRNCVEMIYESAKTNYDLLSNLLDWSRLQLGKIKVCPENLEIQPIIDIVLDQTKMQAYQKNITLINNAEPCFAWADRNMLVTIIRNFVCNGIKFTNSGGQVIVGAHYTGEEVEISVQDTGIGISENVAATIFKANNMMTSTMGTAREPGTGIGLVLCKEFVEMNHGKIWLKSKPGDGSIFFFTLPAKKSTT